MRLAGSPRALGFLAPILALALSCGCGLLALTHDEVLGPVSPAGTVHTVTVGGNFHVTDEGVAAEDLGEPLLRPYPVELFDRLARPQSMYFLVKGGNAAIAGLSPVVKRDINVGRPLARDQLAKLHPGLSPAEVLELLGSPEQWIRREEGSIMAYRATVGRALTVYVGLPPGLSQFLPVPGLNNLQLHYAANRSRPYQTVLFFDRDEVLRAIVTNLDEEETAEKGSEGATK